MLAESDVSFLMLCISQLAENRASVMGRPVATWRPIFTDRPDSLVDGGAAGGGVADQPQLACCVSKHIEKDI